MIEKLCQAEVSKMHSFSNSPVCTNRMTPCQDNIVRRNARLVNVLIVAECTRPEWNNLKQNVECCKESDMPFRSVRSYVAVRGVVSDRSTYI